MRRGGGGGQRGGAGAGLTTVGECEALRVATSIAVEGEQDCSDPQAQRPGWRRAGPVEGPQQASRGDFAKLQSVARVCQLEKAEGELQRCA